MTAGTPLLLWGLLVALATGATVLWAFVRDTNVYLTSGTAFLCWSVAAILAGDLVVGIGDQAVAVQAASVQYVSLFLALVSVVVFMLRHFSAYPPEQTEQLDQETP
jgi:hypothetical protein